MVKLLSLACLAFAASTVSAVDILFRRFSRHSCEPLEHIAADTHLHDPHCKSFDMDEPVFYSYEVKREDDNEDLLDKFCKATVYDGWDCTGRAVTFGDMNDYIGRCANSTIPGRSVRISCDKDPSITRTQEMPETTEMTPSPRTHEQEHLPTTTVTLVPSWHHDDCDDCDGWW